MSQASAFQCPNCGGPLDVPETSVLTVRCPFCNTSVVVPEALRRKSDPATSFQQPGTPISITVGSLEGAPPLGSQTSRRGLTWIGCLVIFIFLTTLASIAIPLVVTGIFMQDFFSQIPGLNQLNIPGTSSHARQIASFGGEGIGPGLFQGPRAVAVDGSGNIYVADWEDGRIQRLDHTGKFLSQWKVEGKNVYIDSMVATLEGTVYIAAEGIVHKFNGSTGEIIEQYSFMDYDFGYFDSVVLGADGNIYVLADTDSILRLSPSGQITRLVEKAIETQTDDPVTTVYMAMDGLGNFYLFSSHDDAVFRFDANGKYINRFGSEGDEPGQFTAPSAIAVDGQGRIYVSDFSQIKIFETDGRYVGSFPTNGVAYGLTYVAPNRMYAVTYQNIVQVFELNNP